MLDKIVEDVIRRKANAMKDSAEYKKYVKEFAQEIKDPEKVFFSWSDRCNELRRGSINESSASSELSRKAEAN